MYVAERLLCRPFLTYFSVLTGIGHEKVSLKLSKSVMAPTKTLSVKHPSSCKFEDMPYITLAPCHYPNGYGVTQLPFTYRKDTYKLVDLSSLPQKFDFTHGWMISGAIGLAAFTLATCLAVRPIRTLVFELFLIMHIILIVSVLLIFSFNCI